MSSNAQHRETRQDNQRRARASDPQPRFKPVALRAIAAACAVRGPAPRTLRVQDIPAILRDTSRTD